MKVTSIRIWMRKNVREAIIYLGMGVLMIYILFGMHIAFWMKLVVIALMAFGTYEAIGQIKGQPSKMNKVKKEIHKAHEEIIKTQKEMQKSMQGFGPFRGNP